MSGFKNFLMRGNVVDMAVGVVIGGAFGAVVASLVKDLLTPFIALVVGQPDFSAIKLQVGNTTLGIGAFVNAIVAFVLVAAAIYFFVVLPMNTLMARMNKPAPAPAPTTKKCKECASDIPLEAKRCRFCTQPA
jgi:large conductance mechanosensitive channel